MEAASLEGSAEELDRRIDQRVHDQLEAAVGTREIIGQAQGILMEREGRTRRGAFDLLRIRSQRTNRKLRDVATDVVTETEDHAAS